MRVQSLEVHHYRNLSQLKIDCPQDLHIFVGPNAQGKTNILESLYVLALGKSHRTRSSKELIQFGEKQSILRARVKRDSRVSRLEVQLRDLGKKVSINGIEQSKLSQYIGFLPAVLFAPEDLSIVKGSPSIRRRFLDMEIGQVSPTYVYHLSQLNKLLSQRNSLLKEIGVTKKFQVDFLDVYDEQFLSLSLNLWRKRFSFLKLLIQWSQEIHQSITESKEELMIDYLPSIPIHAEMNEDEMRQVLQRELHRVRQQEIRRGSTLLGPQRDDFRLLVNGLDLHTFGSQGQQRTAALSLKLAEIELIRQETGVYPILLLDDVLSELDDSRKTHLLEAIRGRVQTFVTTTNLEGIDEQTLANAQIYHIKQGTISELR